jgi:hypothetical protein
MKKSYVIGGSIAMIAGVVLLLSGLGLIDIKFPTSTLSVTPFGNRLGIQLQTSKMEAPLPFSFVSRGYTYKWKVDITNTGTVTWSTGWVNVRLGVNGATAVQTTCSANPASCPDTKVGGSFYVERCSSGTDVTACREDLTAWGFKFSGDGTNWLSCPGGTYPGGKASATYNNKVCSIDLGDVTPGTKKTIYFQLTIPSSATDGNYPFIVQAMAWADATYAVAGQYDTLTVGAVAGNLVLTFIGFLSLLGGVSAIALGMK